MCAVLDKVCILTSVWFEELMSPILLSHTCIVRLAIHILVSSNTIKISTVNKQYHNYINYMYIVTCSPIS